MKTLKSVLCLLVFLRSLFCFAEMVEVRIDELPELVLKKNRHVKGAQSNLQASRARTGFLLRSYSPNISVSGGYETFKTGSYSKMEQPYGIVEGSVNLFRGGKDLLESQVRNASVQVSHAEAQQTYLGELTEARKLLWNMVFQREMMAILNAAIAQNEKNLVAANQRILGGIATETDRLEFKMNRIQLEQDLTRIMLGNANAQRLLSVLIGFPESVEFNTLNQIPHQHDDSLLSMQFDASAHRDVRALLANMEISRYKKNQAYRWWVPSIDAYTNYSLYTLRDREYLSRQDRYETVAGVRFTADLFDGLQSKVEGAAFSLQSEAFENQALQTENELRARFESSKQELKLTHELIHSAEESVEQGAQYLQRTLAEYARGVKNSPDVLGASQKYIEFKRRSAELRKDYQLSRADLLAAIGQ